MFIEKQGAMVVALRCLRLFAFFITTLHICCYGSDGMQHSKFSWGNAALGVVGVASGSIALWKLWKWKHDRSVPPARSKEPVQSSIVIQGIHTAPANQEVDVKIVGTLIDRITQNAPASVVRYFAEFCPQGILASPAPSLRRTRACASEAYLLAVTNQGELVLGNTGDSHTRIIFRGNTREEALTHVELSDGWQMQGNYQCAGALPVHKIYDDATGARKVKFGRFDIDAREITELADLDYEWSWIWTMNHHAAVIRRPGEDGFYLVKGTKKRLITGITQRPRKMSIDRYSDRVMWQAPDDHEILMEDCSKEWARAKSCYDVGEGESIGEKNNANVGILQKKEMLVLGCAETIFCYDKPPKSINIWRLKACHVIPSELRYDNNQRLVGLCDDLYALNNTGTIAFGTMARKDCNCADPLYASYPMGMNLETGVVFYDDCSREHAHAGEHIQRIVVSSNGHWIAARWNLTGVLWLWQVRGADIMLNCSWENRIYLDEFRKLYDKAKKLCAYIHLSSDLWSKFQELRTDPKCEVPTVWNVRFKQPRPS